MNSFRGSFFKPAGKWDLTSGDSPVNIISHERLNVGVVRCRFTCKHYHLDLVSQPAFRILVQSAAIIARWTCEKVFRFHRPFPHLISIFCKNWGEASGTQTLTRATATGISYCLHSGLIALRLRGVTCPTSWKVNSKTPQMMQRLKGKVATSSAFILQLFTAYHFTSVCSQAKKKGEKTLTCGVWGPAVLKPDQRPSRLTCWTWRSVTLSHKPHILCQPVTK